MATGIEVARLFGTIALNDEASDGLDRFDRRMGGLSDTLTNIGGRVSSFGAGLVAMTAPALAGFGAATNSAMQFDESLTNIAAVMGRAANSDFIVDLGGEMIDLANTSRFGANTISEAMYDIVGGVADASTHMAILQASVSTAQAGNADLGATTSAMISIMNSYGFSAEQAAFASDVLTRTVGMGVGTMDQFASALPNVAGLAASTGVEFDNLAASMAYMTTKGYSTTQAATRLQAVITSLLNPNERMRAAMAEAGIESGSTALEMYGLAGTLGRLDRALGGSQDALAGALGSVEALQAAVVLNQAGFEGFIGTFVDGVDGATAAAESIQMTSAAAQFDRLKSSIESVGIRIGDALLPALTGLVEQVQPTIVYISQWISANPELIQQIAGIVAVVAGLGAGLVVLGQVITGVGTVIGVLTSPIGLAVAAVVGLVAAYQTNFGGIRDFIDGQVRPRLDQFFAFLAGVWEQVRPALEAIGAWFMNDALPAVVEFITNTVVPGVQNFINILAGIWDAVSLGLTLLSDWFTTTALPAIVGFVSGTVVPAVQGFINLVAALWDSVRPGLEPLFTWFQNTFIQIVTFIQSVIDKFNEMVNTLGGGLGAYAGVSSNANQINALVGSGQVGVGDVISAAWNAIGAEFRAGGGPVAAGSPYVVGENGPELFLPSQSGTVVPNGGIMGDTINVQVIVNGSVSDADWQRRGDDLAERIHRQQRQRG